MKPLDFKGVNFEMDLNEVAWKCVDRIRVAQARDQ